MTLFRGDNTAAFGNNFLTIKIKNPDLMPISKILFVVNGGLFKKTFTDANNFQVVETTLTVNFNSAETEKFSAVNVGNVVVYDIKNRQQTCPQSLTFYTQGGVINNVKCSC